MKNLLAFLKRFEIFIGLFFCLITLIVIPGNIVQGNYLNIIIYLIISVGIISILLGLHFYFHSLAIEVRFDDDDIYFNYKRDTEKVKISQVKSVICRPNKYTFLLNDGRKFNVGRYTGGIGVEKQIMPELYQYFDSSIIITP